MAVRKVRYHFDAMETVHGRWLLPRLQAGAKMTVHKDKTTRRTHPSDLDELSATHPTAAAEIVRLRAELARIQKWASRMGYIDEVARIKKALSND